MQALVSFRHHSCGRDLLSLDAHGPKQQKNAQTLSNLFPPPLCIIRVFRVDKCDGPAPCDTTTRAVIFKGGSAPWIVAGAAGPKCRSQLFTTNYMFVIQGVLCHVYCCNSCYSGMPLKLNTDNQHWHRRSGREEPAASSRQELSLLPLSLFFFPPFIYVAGTRAADCRGAQKLMWAGRAEFRDAGSPTAHDCQLACVT